MTDVISVVVVDDEPVVRDGISLILTGAGGFALLGEAADGAAAVELARTVSPDLVLMDVRMPRMDGIEATRRITAEPGAPRVALLTTFDLDEYVYEGLRAGASGFLLKSLPTDQLVSAIRTVARGDLLLAPEVTRRLIERFVQVPPVPPAELAELTPRELEVLRELGKGRSNAEIGQPLFISETTVRTHINRVFSKLGLRDRVQAVVYAYEAGLIRVGDAKGTT